jgi:hypothetical protein
LTAIQLLCDQLSVNNSILNWWELKLAIEKYMVKSRGMKQLPQNIQYLIALCETLYLQNVPFKSNLSDTLLMVGYHSRHIRNKVKFLEVITDLEFEIAGLRENNLRQGLIFKCKQGLTNLRRNLKQKLAPMSEMKAFNYGVKQRIDKGLIITESLEVQFQRELKERGFDTISDIFKLR